MAQPLTPTTLEQEHAAVEAMNRRLVEAVDRRDKLSIALQLASAPVDPRSSVVRERVGEQLIDLAKRNPRQVRRELESLYAEIAQLQTELPAAQAAYQEAAQGEADQVAERFRPAHVEAVRAIATALSALSQALAHEAEVRINFSKAAPPGAGASALLPNMSGALGWARLDDWRSAASAWCRRGREIGILR
jgi:hypothetical protein